MHAYLCYSIAKQDAHMVYELGGVIEQSGSLVEYHHANPDYPKGQHAYDEVASSRLYVGFVTGGSQKDLVLQLWQYAKAQGIPAVLLAEKGITLPSAIARNPDVHVFNRYMPENPIRFIQLWVSRS